MLLSNSWNLLCRGSIKKVRCLVERAMLCCTHTHTTRTHSHTHIHTHTHTYTHTTRTHTTRTRAHTHSHVHTQGSEEDEDRLPLPSPSWEAQNPGSGINPLGTGTLPANAANLQQHLAKVPHAFTHMWKHGINQSLWNPLLGWPAPCHFEACGTKRHDRNLGTANTHMTGKGWLDRVLPSILSCLVLRQS